MKILVPVAIVNDPGMTVHMNRDGRGVDTINIKKVANPFDEVAMEQAVRLKESGQADEIVVVLMGPQAKSEVVIRSVLARGADRGVHILIEGEFQAFDVARSLKALIDREKPDLVLMGKQATDFETGHTGPLLAGLLNWPQALAGSPIKIDDASILVTREIKDQLETIEMDIPAVVTVALGVANPRIVGLSQIMRSKKIPIDVVTLCELSIPLVQDQEITCVSAPPRRPAGVKVANIQELAEKLRHHQFV